mgnify:CR=1 FL=1
MDVFLVMRRGKRFFGGIVDITFMKRSDKNFSEAKVVVSQKVAKKAVDRHKIKRRIREIMRHIIKEKTPLSRGYDFVVFAKPSSSDASFCALKT